ncbi:MAG: hypothetical protein AAF958_01385 [Planctomycetota bacterium]
MSSESINPYTSQETPQIVIRYRARTSTRVLCLVYFIAGYAILSTAWAVNTSVQNDELHRLIDVGNRSGLVDDFPSPAVVR